MTAERSSIFAEDAVQPARPPADQVRALAEGQNFTSRASQPVAPATAAPAPRHKPRLHRTGRNTPFSCKVTQAAYERIYALADEKDWKVGETVEKALAALEREIARERAGEG